MDILNCKKKLSSKREIENAQISINSLLYVCRFNISYPSQDKSYAISKIINVIVSFKKYGLFCLLETGLYKDKRLLLLNFCFKKYF